MVNGVLVLATTYILKSPLRQTISNLITKRRFNCQDSLLRRDSIPIPVWS